MEAAFCFLPGPTTGVGGGIPPPRAGLPPMRLCIPSVRLRIRRTRTRIPSPRARLLEMLRAMPAVRQVSPLVDVRTQRLHDPFRVTRAPLPEIAGRLRFVAELASENRGRRVLVRLRRIQTVGPKLALPPRNHLMALHEEHETQHHGGNRERHRALRSRTARLRVPNRDDVTALNLPVEADRSEGCPPAGSAARPDN